MKYRHPIKLANGVTVQLTALHQDAHYEGLLEGLPTREMNAETLDALKRSGAHVVWAPETLIAWAEARPYPFCVPAQLPPVMCIASVRTSDGPLHVRLARLAWFQSDWAFPIDPDALNALGSVDWGTVSEREEI